MHFCKFRRQHNKTLTYSPIPLVQKIAEHFGLDTIVICKTFVFPNNRSVRVYLQRKIFSCVTENSGIKRAEQGQGVVIVSKIRSKDLNVTNTSNAIK